MAALLLLCLAVAAWAWSGSRWIRGRPVRQHRAAGLEFARQGRGARPVLERVIRLDPNNADAYAELGIGWLDDASAPDHRQRAERALHKALELNPLNAQARLALGKLYVRENRARPAITQLEEAARL